MSEHSLVLLILGFLVLPAFVVTIAAFNDKAMLSFPPQGFSLRWFARAIDYQDFREGFRNGLIVTLWASRSRSWLAPLLPSCSTVTQLRFKTLLEGVLLSPLCVPALHGGVGFSGFGGADRVG